MYVCMLIVNVCVYRVVTLRVKRQMHSALVKEYKRVKEGVYNLNPLESCELGN